MSAATKLRTVPSSPTGELLTVSVRMPWCSVEHALWVAQTLSAEIKRIGNTGHACGFISRYVCDAASGIEITAYVPESREPADIEQEIAQLVVGGPL